MLYEKLMMDTATYTKFKLFQELTHHAQRAEYPIVQLSKKLALNYQRTVTAVNELDKELVQINTTQKSLLKKPGKVTIAHLLVTIDDYRYFLLKQSIPFQYLLYILNHPQPNIDDFCQQYFVSRSTFTRKIAPLKEFLEPFNLHFSYTDASLLGDERLVRSTFFNLIWLGTRGIFWPFALSRDQIKPYVETFAPYFSLSKIFLGKIELEFLAAICIARAKRHCFAPYDPRYDLLMKNNPYYDFQLLKQTLDPYMSLTYEQLKGESGLVFFFSHYAPFYTLEDRESFQQTLKNFARKPNVIRSFVKGFIAEAEQNIFNKGLSAQNFPIIKSNLLNITYTYYVLRQAGPTLQLLAGVPVRKTKAAVFLEKEITAYFNNQEKKSFYSFIQPIKREMIRSFQRILIPFYEEPAYLQHLKVGLSFEHNFFFIRKLYRFFDQLGFVDCGTYCEKNNKYYDLVISSSFLPLKKYPTLPFYYWDIANENDDFTQLYQKLHQLYTEKNQAT